MEDLTKQIISDDVKVFALGGLNEVGKNMYIIEYRDEILILDAGVRFPEDEQYGIDYIIPNFTYLLENKDKIKGLFITHGHEDHIGGIPYLLKQIDIPRIYANGLAIELIKKKLDDFPGLNANFYEYNTLEKINFRYLSVSFFRVNHSIPDSFGVIISTPYGDIVSSGDFKLDLTPVGPDADYQKICSLGQKGVLLLMQDSTNSRVKELSTSEKTVADSISDLFREEKGRVIIATFASNVNRINSIIDSSVKNGRKICILGRSMENVVHIGRDLGYILASEDHFIDIKTVDSYPKDKITIICTGSQGEPMSALSRMVKDTGVKPIKIGPGDTVIFSSSAIPGNSIEIDNVINRLTKLGADVVVQSTLNDVHASGHASSHEQKIMIKLLRPKYFMPMHGEYYMLKTHAQSAKSCGIPANRIFIMENGKVLAINQTKARILSKSVPCEEVLIDGTDIGGVNTAVVQERKALSKRGMVTIIITLNKNNKVMVKPTVISKGFLFAKDNQEVFDKIEEYIDMYFEENTLPINEFTKTDLSAKMEEYIKEICGQNPLIFTILNSVY